MPIALGELDLDEVLRYMGTPPSQAGPELRALVEECGRAVCAAARPRWAWRAFDIAEEADGVCLSCGLLLPGQDLKRHLRGCGRAAVFCATLSAQVDALIRRSSGGTQELPPGTISQPPFLLNTRNRTLEKNGQRIKLTQVEYSIMRMFMENPGKALSREEILDLVWGRDYFGELKIVDVNVRRLRLKIEDSPTSPTYINTVWGYGYKWGF